MAGRSGKGGGKSLKSNVWVGDPAVLFLAGSTPPKEYADQITNPNAWEGGVAPEPEAAPQGGDDGDSDGDGDNSKGYGDLKVADLKAEIVKRNEGREEADLISLEGTKSVLAAALKADDESESDGESEGDGA